MDQENHLEVQISRIRRWSSQLQIETIQCPMIKSLKTIGLARGQHGLDTTFNQEYNSMFLKKVLQAVQMSVLFYEIE